MKKHTKYPIVMIPNEHERMIALSQIKGCVEEETQIISMHNKEFSIIIFTTQYL
jgi:hypothetical protein